jgi:hypothetical protein
MSSREDEYAYTFSVLRYMHDPVTQEFANIGVALYSKECRYLGAKCDRHYARITRIFGKIDGERFRQSARYIQDRVQTIGENLRLSLPFEGEATIESLLATVLPPDDSAFQFSAAGIGLTADMDGALAQLFARFVENYSLRSEPPKRDDEEVWKSYREPLERHHVIYRLEPKKIASPDFDYQFDHAWKNEKWHLYEPVSFDLLEASSILDKANRWLGRGYSLVDSPEQFRVHFLMGEPRDASLRGAFVKAQNILHKMPGKPEFVSESEAEEFAVDLAEKIKAHDNSDPR